MFLDFTVGHEQTPGVGLGTGVAGASNSGDHDTEPHSDPGWSWFVLRRQRQHRPGSVRATETDKHRARVLPGPGAPLRTRQGLCLERRDGWWGVGRSRHGQSLTH